MSGGITTAAITSPDSTFSIACCARADVHGLHLAEEFLGVLAHFDALAAHLRPSRPAGVSSTIATRGLEGLREIAKPISSAIATG